MRSRIIHSALLTTAIVGAFAAFSSNLADYDDSAPAVVAADKWPGNGA